MHAVRWFGACPADPGRPGRTRGEVCSTPASLVDVFPTVLQGIGVGQPGDPSVRPGRSLFDLARGRCVSERFAFSEYHAVGSASGAFMVRSDRYKYIHYVGHAPELFDVESDPGETTDISGSKPALVREHEALWRSVVDPADADRRAKLDQAGLVERYGGREVALQSGTPGATPIPSR